MQVMRAWLGGRFWHAGPATPPGVRRLGPRLSWRACVRQPLQLVQLAVHLLLRLEHLRAADMGMGICMC